MNQSFRQLDARPLGQPSLWPRWWRWTVIALSVLVLCSCRTMPDSRMPESGTSLVASANAAAPSPTATSARRVATKSAVAPASAEMPLAAGQHDSLPPSAFTGEHYADCPRIPMPGEQAVPFWATQWAPPGIARPWPEAEYLHDGGDRGKPARPGRNWQIRGLETEDTVAQYDTLDGRVVIEPSNRVHLYAPRFGVVRRVRGLEQYAGGMMILSDNASVAAVNQEQHLDPGTVLQPQGAKDQVATRNPTVQQRDLPSLTSERTLVLAEMAGDLLPYEDFGIIRNGIAQQADKPLLAIHVDAAIVWSHDKGVEVEINRQSAQVETGDQRAQATYTIDNPNQAELRIVKVASREAARPGDFVEFTLRYDNTGTEEIGNVTIVDNLTTRLEYVPDSQSSSREAEFVTKVNEGGSLLLRWEIKDPLPIGEGGTIRFRCRVR